MDLLVILIAASLFGSLGESLFQCPQSSTVTWECKLRKYSLPQVVFSKSVFSTATEKQASMWGRHVSKEKLWGWAPNGYLCAN